MERREFLKKMAVGLGALAGLQLVGSSKVRKEAIIPRRPLGRTGVKLSVIGLGGVTVMGMPQADANRLVHEAIDRGINYVDVAPTYGNAEELLGPVLRGRRDEVFLSCKTLERKRQGAYAELKESLRKLGTDHLDLYQFHALRSTEDVETIFGPDGAMEAFLEARDEGLIRYIGFSAHSVRAALEAMERFRFDTVLFPVNFVLYFKENFGPQVVERARQKGTAVLAIKAMAKGKWPKGAKRGKFPKCWYMPTSDPREASLALRFTLSQPVTAAVPPGNERLFRMAMDVAADFVPVTHGEVEELKKVAEGQEPIFKLDI